MVEVVESVELVELVESVEFVELGCHSEFSFKFAFEESTAIIDFEVINCRFFKRIAGIPKFFGIRKTN